VEHGGGGGIGPGTLLFLCFIVMAARLWLALRKKD
jgi:hypothetical protein